MSITYNLFDNQSTFKQEVTQRPQWLDEQLYPCFWDEEIES